MKSKILHFTGWWDSECEPTKRPTSYLHHFSQCTFKHLV